MNRTVAWRLLPLAVFTFPLFLQQGASAPCTAVPVKKDEKPAQKTADWSYWRGPVQNGVSLEKDLPDKFSTDPKDPKSNLIWQANIGGRSTPIVMGNHVYLITSSGEKENEQEQVVCFDADNGKDLWHYKFNVWLTQIVSERIGWTNLVGDEETGNIYAHGTQGLLLCLSKDGKLLWQRSLTEEFGRVSGYGGRITSPIVDSGLVIMGFPNSSWGEYATGGIRFMAFDKNNGEVVWETHSLGGPPRTYSSNPVVAVINGQRLLISGGGDGAVHAMKVRTGEVVWRYQFANAGVNPTPVVDGNYVYIAHGEANFGTTDKGRVICVDASKINKPAKAGEAPSPTLVWKQDGLEIKFSSPVIHDGRLYVCDETAEMSCLDAKTGDELWSFTYGKEAKGSPVLADGKLYICEVNGKFLILKPGKDKCEKIFEHTFRNPNPNLGVTLNGSPAIVNGRIYFCNSFATYCIGKKNHEDVRAKMPELPKESAPAKDAKITHLQVVPAEVAVEQGKSVSFKVRGFDADGHFIKEVEVKDWALQAAPRPEGLPPPPKEGDPPPAAPPPLKGEIKDGKITVDDKLPAQMGTVVAKLDGIEGQARVRVYAKLPFAADFSKVPLTRTPAGWVNTQGKFQMRKDDDKNVLVKLAETTNPSLSRAYAYIGVPTMTDYTIEADVLGKKSAGDLPDLGIVANRYVLMLTGATQAIRIASWEDKPRVDKAIGYAWKPDVWYRLKLTVQVKDGAAVVRGKVWERGKDEPKDWTVEYTDKTPNTEGTPALYGYAPQEGMESHFNNVKITPNSK
jgi:outer membrane protein assembly factor BamB